MSVTAPTAITELHGQVQTFQANPGAVVTGGDYRGLALVRSLGRKGIPVWVVNQADHWLAGTSRYAARTLFYPNWEGERGIEFLLEAGRKHGLNGWLLFPTSDESVHLISRHHQRLTSQFRLTVPAWDKLQVAVDKRLMHQLADRLGVDHPRTFYPRRREDLGSFGLSFPVILKPASRERFNKLTASKAWPVEHLDDLRRRYDEACEFLPPDILMIQEIIPGGGESQFSFAAVCKDGEVLASLVARRTRQFPIDFGRASTFVETVDDPGISEPSTRFLRALQYTGIVEIEFKRDPRDGQFKLLDFNPRVWGWYSLAERAGVNFSYLLWRLLLDQPTPKLEARSGARWMRLSTDTLVSLREILRGRLAIRDYLRSLRGPTASAIFARDDLRPGLLELPSLLYLVGKRMLRGRGI